MSERLITAQEVIDLAFTSSKVRTQFIKDTTIDIAQLSFLLPVLGSYHETLAEENIYNMITLTAYVDLDKKYQDLINNYIKPALAYYIKYLIIPEIFTQITNIGIQKNDTENSNSASTADKNTVRAQAKSDAEVLIGELTRFLDNSSLFTEYSEASNKVNTFSHKGGIIIKRKRLRK